MSDPKKAQKAEENAKKLDEMLSAQNPNRVKLSSEMEKKVNDVIDFANKHLPTPGKAIDGVIMLGDASSNAVEAVSGWILSPFKRMGEDFKKGVSDICSKTPQNEGSVIISSLQKYICGCSNQTETPTTQATPNNTQQKVRHQ